MALVSDKNMNSILALTLKEAELIVKDFDRSEKQDETGPEYYNSFGVYNVKQSLEYVPRLTYYVQKKYPWPLKFANSYTRSYHSKSFLALHVDRKELDVTVSVCLENKHNYSWPLHISSCAYAGEDLYNETVKQKYMAANYSSIDFNKTGYCALLEGKIFPHWRDQLSCKKSHRIIYVYYHWSI